MYRIEKHGDGCYSWFVVNADSDDLSGICCKNYGEALTILKQIKELKAAGVDD